MKDQKDYTLQLLAFIFIVACLVSSCGNSYKPYDNGIAMLNAKDSTLSEILRIQDKHRTDNFDRWKSCIEASDYTDSECGQCDYLYNKNGKFKLD